MKSTEFIKKAKALRARADDAERELMEFLLAGEADVALWHDTGLTFAEFVERAGICKASRWTAWKRGYEAIQRAGAAEAGQAVDVEAAMAIGSLKRDDEVRAAVEQCARWRDSNDTSISPSAARRVVRDVRIGSVAHRNRNRSMSDMEREIEALRVKLDEERTKTKALRAEVRSLKAKLKRAQRADRDAA